MKNSRQLITKSMTIGDAVNKYPEAAGVMLDYGLHCIGCHVNPFESIEMGAKAHGMDDKEINAMLKEVNKKLSKSGNDAETNSITITTNSISKIKELLKREGKVGYGLRINVIPGGCAGQSYGMRFDKKIADNDEVIEKDGVKVIIDKDSFEILKGSKVDYIEGLEGSGFKVSNPNAKTTCGCGKSFR